MDCTKIQDLLVERSAGLLDSKSLSEVEHHLKECEGCRKEEARLAMVMQAVDSLPMKEPPYGLWYGVEQRITQVPEKRPGWGSLLRRRIALGMASAAAALVLVWGGVSMTHTPVPQVARADGSTHVMQYASLGADQPFSDQVALGSLAGVASDDAPISH